MRRIVTDVTIVGSGIAGSVLSLLLKRRGFKHVLLAREERKSIQLSETLPPSTLPLLEQMDLLELFEESSSRTFGYHAIWANERITSDDFFNHNPFKFGLKLDKPKLLGEIQKMNQDSICSFSSLLDVAVTDGKALLRIAVDKEEHLIESKLVIDATGRNRAVLKQLGVLTDPFDELISFTCHLPFKKHPNLIHKVFVESFENGWGIVSSLNSETNVMTVFTQKGSAVHQQLKNYHSWNEILQHTQILKFFLEENYETKVIGGNANSSKATKITGNHWLALGDAAISFDPLSSHGVSNAIYCANEAADSIEAFLKNGEIEALNDYEHKLSSIFQTYLEHKSKLYNAEKRWSEAAFWRNAQTTSSENGREPILNVSDSKF